VAHDGRDGETVVDVAAPHDLDALMRILSVSFPAPWSRSVMEDELARPFAHVWVLRPRAGAEVLAFVDFWHVADEIHLLNLATDVPARRQGHGRRLMRALLEYARRHAVAVATLELRESNLAARRLYESLGFRPIDVRARYYADNGEDAVVMAWRPLPA
jgi:[ribosomal protein S18]-alanine N-acetyltransferase